MLPECFISVCEKSMLVQTTIKARGMTSWLPRVIFFSCLLFHVSVSHYKLVPERLDSYWPSFVFIYRDICFSYAIFGGGFSLLRSSHQTVDCGDHAVAVWLISRYCVFLDWLLIFSLWIGRLWTVLRVYVDFWMLFRHFCPMDHWTVNWGIYVAVRTWIEYSSWHYHSAKLWWNGWTGYSLPWELDHARSIWAGSHAKRKKYYDQRRRPASYSVDELVRVKTHPCSDALANFTAKLAPVYTGPYRVTQKLSEVNYRLTDV